MQTQQADLVKGEQTAQDRLASAVSALQSKGVSDLHSTEQILKDMQSSSEEAPHEPPKHLLPPEIDSYYHIKVSLKPQAPPEYSATALLLYFAACYILTFQKYTSEYFWNSKGTTPKGTLCKA